MARMKSNYSVDETLNRLEAALAERGVPVAGRFDHAKNAASVGVEMLPTQLLMFGNPKVGTPLIAADRRAGLELPMKALAYEDADGVWLETTDPDGIKAKLNLQGVDENIEMMNKVLAALSAAATQ